MSTSPKTPAKPPLDFKELRKLADFLAETGLEEIEMDLPATGHVRLKRPGFGTPVAYAPPQAAVSAAPAAAQPEATDSKNNFTAPMVGTFYQSSSPESAPFVKVGDTIKPGQPLCIIEAMKTMNQIESDRTGTIKKILVTNGTPVEYGQPLFIIQ